MINKDDLEFVLNRFLNTTGVEIDQWLLMGHNNDIFVCYNDFGFSYAWDGSSATIPMDYYLKVLREDKIDTILDV